MGEGERWEMGDSWRWETVGDGRHAYRHAPAIRARLRRRHMRRGRHHGKVGDLDVTSRGAVHLPHLGACASRRNLGDLTLPSVAVAHALAHRRNKCWMRGCRVRAGR